MAASAARYGGNLLLHILEYFHEPELVGSGLVIYVIVSRCDIFFNGLPLGLDLSSRLGWLCPFVLTVLQML